MKSKFIIYISLGLYAMSLSGCGDRLGQEGQTCGSISRLRLVPSVSEINDLAPTAQTRAMAENRVVAFRVDGASGKAALTSANPDGASASGSADLPQFYLHIEPSLEMGLKKMNGDTRAIYSTDNTISTLNFRIYREGDPDGKAYVEKGETTRADNWITDTEWPHGSGKKFRVISLSPFEPYFIVDGHIENEAELNFTTSPIFTYEMPDIEEQEDLIYAESDALDPEASHVVAMNYRHLLSGIAFSEGAMVSGFKIKTVQIKGLYSKGKCDLNKGDISWTVDKTATKDFTITKDYTAVGRNPNLITPTDRDELMVIPQTAPEGATMTVTLELPKVGEKTLTASIAGAKFERGLVYWFMISTSAVNWRYTLNVSQTELSTPYKGGTAAITVNSWRTSANNDGSTPTQVAEPYKIEYSEDNGSTWTETAPTWLTSVPAYASGQLSNDTNVTTSEQTAQPRSHTSNLRNKTAVTNYDLSLYDLEGKEIIGGSSTSNCYVISGPGTYRIPCVYGNTLKKNQYNGYAVDYLNESGKSEAFVDYDGTPISESNYKFTPSSAGVLWQSTGSPVSNVSVSSDNGMSYVTFTVSAANLSQGNAVIAARNSSGTVMWSWHLWITDAKLTTSVSNFLTQNLGWVSDDSYNHYPARSVQLKITQTNPLSDAESVIVTLSQTEADVDINPDSGSGLYYQWGRKDPFRGSDITEDNSRLYTSYKGAPLKYSIQYPSSPMLYYYSSYGSSDTFDWTSDHYNVLWNSRYSTQSTNTPVEKSVYDPCPYGYRAPRGNKTYTEIYTTLPEVDFYRYRLERDEDYWTGYYITVSKQSSKYYWTSRAEGVADNKAWKGYIVSSKGYNNQEYTSSLLPLRPSKDLYSGQALQTSN